MCGTFTLRYCCLPEAELAAQDLGKVPQIVTAVGDCGVGALAKTHSGSEGLVRAYAPGPIAVSPDG